MKRIVILENVIVDNPIWLNHVDYLVKSVLLKSIKLRFQEVKKFEILVKSRLLCKMLYNVFTISTYQN
ncbi:hypothetical protein C7Q23_11445 [Staphylococcus aureus]|uniref:hypothetical protein n=1 Tax=Staphylococcus aureus TaxID=1280 RepID=UPI000DA872B8|nr:hypothetical protein [Staphylococcus aureus]PZJ28682.1 hypothetical protein C7Q23_11445 [Staphylococcus aureus]PZL49286.1 hypothetical protein C7P80_11930 [Staphylococcus aureus]